MFYSIHPGKIKDSKAFKDCMDELMVERGRTMVVIDPDTGTELDKGFASGSNLEKLEEYGFSYVVSLRRNDPYLDYSYKERGTDEDMIRTLKTVAKADKTYMQEEIALEGWMFINFLALLWLYLIRDHIEDHGMLKRYSPAHVCDTFSGINVLRIGDDWKLAGITANDQRVLKKLGLLPPIDEKYVCDDRSASDA